jgi:hypothetical protein
VRAEGEFDRACQAIFGQRSGAPSCWRIGSYCITAREWSVTAQHRLPAVYADNELVQITGLMSFGPGYPEMYRRAAYFADRILTGARATDSPNRAADEVRAGHESQNRQGFQPGHPAVAAAAGGSVIE